MFCLKKRLIFKIMDGWIGWTWFHQVPHVPGSTSTFQSTNQIWGTNLQFM